MFAPRELLQGLPPACFLVAQRDILYDEGVAYADRLKDAGVKTSVLVYENAPHPIMAMDGEFPNHLRRRWHILN
jgi:acetyl esterase